MRSSSRLFVVALVLVAAACTGSAPDEGRSAAPREVRIGLLSPQSGLNKDTGIAAVRGAQLAAAIVNGGEGSATQDGGPVGLSQLGGIKLTIVSGDTRGEAEQGSLQAARLVGRERVVGLVGAYDTDVTEVASQRSERLGVPFVNGDASANYLTERGLDWFFRVGPTDRMFGEALLSTLTQLGGADARKIAILTTATQPSSVVASLMKDLADEGGYRVVDSVRFDPSSGDPSASVRKLAAQQPDAVFLIASASDDAERMLKAFEQVRYTPPGMFAFGTGLFEPTVLLAAGRDGEGVLTSTAWSREVAARNPSAKRIMDLYEERFGAPMTEVAAGSFTAVLTLAKAVQDAGSVEPERVRTALLNVSISGRDTIMQWDGVRFDATHQNTAATGIVEQLVDGSFRTVFPRELVQLGPVWPLNRAPER
jgi:branched-chain amino acid transport system substrate-binding protein